MQIIYHLGQLLSEKIGISAASSRGLIKLAIKEQFSPFKPLETLGVRDYQALINNSLKRRLQKLSISNYEEIIKILIDELLTHQSLITMEKI